MQIYTTIVVTLIWWNLGNFDMNQSIDFLGQIRSSMSLDGLLFIGLDLKKDPRVVMQAYNDPNGYTKEFNLNLLLRMNRELGADFKPDHFIHEPTYDPDTGMASSYLLSTWDQEVYFDRIGSNISFTRGKTIFTEQSQKYDMEMILNLVQKSSFNVLENFRDQRKFFVNSLWCRNH